MRRWRWRWWAALALSVLVNRLCGSGRLLSSPIDDRSSGSFNLISELILAVNHLAGVTFFESRIVREMLGQNPDPVGISEQNQTIGQPFNRGHAIEPPGDFWIGRIGESSNQLNGLRRSGRRRARERGSRNRCRTGYRQEAG